MFTVYQCCFTRKEGPVAVSPGISPRARSFCVAAQNAVALNPARRRGGVKSLYEILCDGAYVYVIHTAFGLTDNRGRSSLFSHAYIFLAPEVLSNPDAFLSLSRDNFKTSAKDALQWDGRYESLIREEEMTLETARKIAGADSPEAYQSLTYCAYAQMAHHKKPLFLRYKTPGEDVTEADLNQRIRAFLLCVWSALPFFLRRKFSAVSVPELGGREFHIVMTRSDKPREGLWNPGGIAQNPGIVTQQTQSRIKRYFYLEYAQRLAENPDELSVYYAWLNRNAAEWGDAANETILKLLAQQYQRKTSAIDYTKNPALKCVPANFPTSELAAWLSEAERMPPPASANIQTCVKRMRDEYETRRTKRKPLPSKEDALRKWEEAKREAWRKRDEEERAERRKRDEEEQAERRKRDEAERKTQTQPDTAQTGQTHAIPDNAPPPQPVDVEVFSFKNIDAGSFKSIDARLQIPKGIEHPNAKWYRELARLGERCIVTEFSDRDGEQWADVNEFFAKRPGWPMDAPLRLSDYLFQNRSKNHTLPWYQSWIRLMVALGPVSGEDKEILDELIRIYRAMSPPDCQTLCKYIPPMLNRLKGKISYGVGAKDCRALFVETLKSACMELDETRSNGAPLDMWLLLGEARLGRSNCFDVFNQPMGTQGGDGANAKILNVSPETVIRESYLLSTPPYKEEYAGYLLQHYRKIRMTILQDGRNTTMLQWRKRVVLQWLRMLETKSY